MNIHTESIETRVWTNCGDACIISEGSSLVRPAWPESIREKAPGLRPQYEVLMIAGLPEHENSVLACLKHVDIDDYVDDMEQIESIFGSIPDDPNWLAAYCAEYTGIEPGADRAYKQKGMYSVSTDFVISKRAAKKWCRELGVPEEYLK